MDEGEFLCRDVCRWVLRDGFTGSLVYVSQLLFGYITVTLFSLGLIATRRTAYGGFELEIGSVSLALVVYV